MRRALSTAHDRRARRLRNNMQLSNYLFFTTTCEDALAFYTECGLGRVVEILRHGQNGLPIKNEAMRGSAHILMMRDREQTRLLFERMAFGGTVTTALAIQPWGDYYGKLTDQF